jgi:hypothetical protein
MEEATMSLSDRVREARELADRSLDPADHAYAAALEGAVDAAAREQLSELAPGPTHDGIPDPPVSHIVIPKPGAQT